MHEYCKYVLVANSFAQILQIYTHSRAVFHDDDLLIALWSRSHETVDSPGPPCEHQRERESNLSYPQVLSLITLSYAVRSSTLKYLWVTLAKCHRCDRKLRTLKISSPRAHAFIRRTCLRGVSIDLSLELLTRVDSMND